MPINKNKLEKFCKDYSKVSIDFALGKSSAPLTHLKQIMLKEKFIFEHSGFINKLLYKTKELLDYFS